MTEAERDPAAARPGEHPVAHRLRALREGAAAWERLHALLDEGADRPNLHRPDGTPWSSREVYAHFARYQSSNAAQLHRLLAGVQPLPPSGVDENEQNERWAAEDRALTLEEARAWCDATTRLVSALAMSMPPELWARYGRWYADDVLAPHYESHIRYIESGGREGA